MGLSEFTPAKTRPKIYKFKIRREINIVNLKPALDKFYGACDKSNVSRLDEKCAKRKFRRKPVRRQKQTKATDIVKIAPRKRIIGQQMKRRLRAEQDLLDKTVQAADARKRTVNLPQPKRERVKAGRKSPRQSRCA
ncbi:hypothetical protein [uncultured Campylobacter sp.]|uniref:hypothetical protein n=1 Tax=uncultured Campylobacter sp. TaxID=218934 RepID=UPI00261E9CBE|nr:hypothetical protein [uncultured Campylobacter sp.]